MRSCLVKREESLTDSSSLVGRKGYVLGEQCGACPLPTHTHAYTHRHTDWYWIPKPHLIIQETNRMIKIKLHKINLTRIKYKHKRNPSEKDWKRGSNADIECALCATVTLLTKRAAASDPDPGTAKTKGYNLWTEGAGTDRHSHYMQMWPRAKRMYREYWENNVGTIISLWKSWSFLEESALKCELWRYKLGGCPHPWQNRRERNPGQVGGCARSGLGGPRSCTQNQPTILGLDPRRGVGCCLLRGEAEPKTQGRSLLRASVGKGELQARELLTVEE